MSAPLAVSYVVLWILFLVVAIVLIGVLRNMGVLFSRVGEGTGGRGTHSISLLERGKRLPDVQFVSSRGPVRMTSEFRGRKMAFAIVSPSCEACSGFLDVSLEEGPDPLDRELRTFTVISLGDEAETRGFLAPFKDRWPDGHSEFLMDSNREVAGKWGLVATPAMVIVDAEQRVVRQVVGGRPRPTSSEIGEGGES